MGNRANSFVAALLCFLGEANLAMACEYEITAAPAAEMSVLFEVKNTSENRISLKANEVPWHSSNAIVSALIGAKTHLEAKRVYRLSENMMPTPPLVLEGNDSANETIDMRDLFDLDEGGSIEDGIFLWHFNAKNGCSFGGAVEVGRAFMVKEDPTEK